MGKLTLVDLAGSERVAKTKVEAHQLKETRATNQSLTALTNVLSRLSMGETVVPYRDNKLTKIMADSLGGSAKTLMIVNVAPCLKDAEETKVSL